MIIPVKTAAGGYNIYFEHGAIKKAVEYLNLDRRVLIVTDSGVPAEYVKTVAGVCKKPLIVTIEQGEKSKCFENYKLLLSRMVENGFLRTDCVVAVGGGVVGDLAGFTAASYMRGVDFYNIPTTVLSQVDSSVGGKTAIDFGGYKNIVGAFYQPKAVIIDPDTLKTLPDRQISNGLAEALKMSLTSDAELFSIFENEDVKPSLDRIIMRSVEIKRNVVELDEKESGLRKILNFGHTAGHAIETELEMEFFYHGECVALGMIPMCNESVRKRLLPVLKKLQLPVSISVDTDALIDDIRHDKKATGDKITVIYVNEIGKYEMKTVSFDELEKTLKEVY